MTNKDNNQGGALNWENDVPEPDYKGVAVKELLRIIDLFESTRGEHDSRGNATLNISDHYTVRIRPHFRNIYQLFLLLYTMIFVGGLVLNIGFLYYIVSRRLIRDSIFFYLANIAISDICFLTFGIPYKLAVTLLQSFVFGKFICVCGSMFQQIPSLVGILTYLTIAADRYRAIHFPMKSPLSGRLCLLVVWFLAVCIPLPTAVFHRYANMNIIWNQLKAIHPKLSLPANYFKEYQVCYLFIKGPVLIYARVIFTLFYVLPMAVIAFMYVRCSIELTSRISRSTLSRGVSLEGPMSAPLPETRNTCVSASFASSNANSNAPLCRRSLVAVGGSGGGRTNPFMGLPGSHNGTTGDMETDILSVPRSSLVDQEHRTNDQTEIQVWLERLEEEDSFPWQKTLNRYLIIMVAVYGLAWLPIRVLNLIHPLFLEEAEDRQEKYLDHCYLTFALFSFAATWTNPLIVVLWKSGLTAKVARPPSPFRVRIHRELCDDDPAASAAAQREPKHHHGRPPHRHQLDRNEKVEDAEEDEEEDEEERVAQYRLTQRTSMDNPLSRPIVKNAYDSFGI